MTAISALDISTRLHKSLKWVYTHAGDLGASRIGRSVIFTEEGLENALQRVKEEMASESADRRPETHCAPIHQAGGPGLGKRKAQGAGGATEGADPYGLLA